LRKHIAEARGVRRDSDLPDGGVNQLKNKRGLSHPSGMQRAISEIQNAEVGSRARRGQRGTKEGKRQFFKEGGKSKKVQVQVRAGSNLWGQLDQRGNYSGRET